MKQDKGYNAQSDEVEFLFPREYRNDSNLHHLNWTVTWDGCVENRQTGR